MLYYIGNAGNSLSGTVIYSQNHTDWSAVFQISYELEKYKWYDYKHYFSNNVYINIYLDKQNLIIC